jgi:hypothetical protein
MKYQSWDYGIESGRRDSFPSSLGALKVQELQVQNNNNKKKKKNKKNKIK